MRSSTPVCSHALQWRSANSAARIHPGAERTPSQLLCALRERSAQLADLSSGVYYLARVVRAAIGDSLCRRRVDGRVVVLGKIVLYKLLDEGGFAWANVE